MEHSGLSPDTPDLVWRSSLGMRIVGVLAMVPLSCVGVWIVFQQPGLFFAWAAALFLIALSIFQGRKTWRSCKVVDGYLLAQGRFAARKVDLRDLRQAGAGPLSGVWIQTHHPLNKRGGTALCLPMIRKSTLARSKFPDGRDAAELIRDRAAAAGAQLDPPLGKPEMVPKGKGLMFGA
jgi:hypothetical protein